jgi:5-methyltetrahydropteroyltriglutamate--homocysteine methyltransferase
MYILLHCLLPFLPSLPHLPNNHQVRRLRTLLRTGKLSRTDYERLVDQQVAFAIGVQEAVGLDVLVHGEPERTDMVEYFGVQLGGLAFTLQVRG